MWVGGVIADAVRRPDAGGADARDSGASRRRAQRARARGARVVRAPRRHLASISSSSRSWASYPTRSSESASASTRTLSTTSHVIDSGDCTSASSGPCSLIEVNGPDAVRLPSSSHPLHRYLADSSSLEKFLPRSKWMSNGKWEVLNTYIFKTIHVSRTLVSEALMMRIFLSIPLSLCIVCMSSVSMQLRSKSFEYLFFGLLSSFDSLL